MCQHDCSALQCIFELLTGSVRNHLRQGFPHTGALARTATNIKVKCSPRHHMLNCQVGAVSPLAGVFKGCLKLLLAYFLRSLLEQSAVFRFLG